MTQIRGLTIWQPWAWAIAQGLKDIENRTWAPPASAVGGYLAIHAGKRFSPSEVSDTWRGLVATGLIPDAVGMVTLRDLMNQCGHVVAVARLVGSVRKSTSPWFAGPVGWQLADVVRISPVPCRGAQGLWNLDGPTVAAVRVAWREASPAAKEATP